MLTSTCFGDTAPNHYCHIISQHFHQVEWSGFFNSSLDTLTLDALEHTVIYTLLLQVTKRTSPEMRLYKTHHKVHLPLQHISFCARHRPQNISSSYSC